MAVIPDSVYGAVLLSVIDFFLSFVVISFIGFILALFPYLNRTGALQRPPVAVSASSALSISRRHDVSGNIGLGPVFWLLISEIFPLAIRGRGMSAATIANWLANLVVALTFLDLVDLLGRPGVFFVYAALALVRSCSPAP